jgi:Uma2 family endonuclease
MTLHAIPLSRETTGVARRAWTVADIERMVAAGILTERDRVELIGGEVITMAPKGARHEIVRNELVLYWADRRPRDIKFAEETPLALGTHDKPEPDLILFPSRQRVTDVSAASALLVVEIADSSLSYDLEVKGPRYAAAGVREYWVIDPVSLTTIVHLDPRPDGYAVKRQLAPSDLLVPHLVPDLAVRLADLDVGA